MAAKAPPALGSDDIIRYSDAEHFLSEFTSNLGRGHVYATTERSFKPGSRLAVKIEGPGVPWSVSIQAIVLLCQSGYLGLQVENFDTKALPTLNLLKEEVEANAKRDFDAPTEDGSVSEPPKPLRTPRARNSTVLDEPPANGGPTPQPGEFDEEEDTTLNELKALDVAELDPPEAEPQTVARSSGAPPQPRKSIEPPPPPAPASTADTSALADISTVVKVTKSGIWRSPDPVDFIGRYLAELRHGHLTTYGGPDGEVGDQATLKIASKTVLTIPVEIIAKAGDLITLSIADIDPVTDLAKELAPEAADALASLGLSGAATAPAAPARASVPAAAVSEPPPPPPEPEEEPEDDLPPEPPALSGNAITFRRKKDLAHELDTNIKNGGLFVISSPLPLQQHKTLEVMVGGRDSGIKIEADVVFAAGGKVGFSVPAIANTVNAVKAFLTPVNAPAPAAAAESIPAQARTSEEPGPRMSVPPDPAQVVTFDGEIAPPVSKRGILSLVEKRAKSEDTLKVAPFLLVFEYIARQKLRGVLRVMSKDGKQKTIYFHNGNVAFVTTKPWEEDQAIGRLLVSSRKITEPQMREGVEQSRKTRRPIGRILTSLGYVKQPVLNSTIREQARLKIEDAFTWRRAQYSFGAWENPPVAADLVLVNGLGVVGRHLRNVFEHTTSQDIEEYCKSFMTRRIGVTDVCDQLASKLGLNQKELRFIEVCLADGSKTLEIASTRSPVGRLASLRLSAVFLAMGMAEFVDGSRAVPRGSSISRVEATGVREVRLAMRNELETLKGQNHFEAIGVHWSAHPRSYKDAYNQAKSRFDQRKPPLRDAPNEVKQIAAECLKIIDGAYKLLSNEVQRVRYRKELFDSNQRESSADMLAKQGEIMLMRGDRRGGIEAFEIAFELSPTKRHKELLMRAREGRLV